MIIHQLIGTIGLMLRFWLVEIKLEDELQFRRHYISRIINYYFFLALMSELESNILNLAILIPFPIIFISFLGWDLLFFKKFKSRTYWTKNKGWLILERLTLHIPLIILQLWMIIEGPVNFIDQENIIIDFIGAIILLYLPWLLWDERWKNKDFLPKTRRDISINAQLCVIGFIIYFSII